jgi:hypothetical protein
MDDFKTKETLYIPQGLKKRREYFTGYGKHEFHLTIVATLITVILCVLLYFITHNVIISMFLFMAAPFTTVLFIVKNDSNISVVDQIRYMISYAKEQKHYKYIYQKEL